MDIIQHKTQFVLLIHKNIVNLYDFSGDVQNNLNYKSDFFVCLEITFISAVPGLEARFFRVSRNYFHLSCVGSRGKILGDDVLLLEAAADADVEVLVPPAVLGNSVSATVEGPVLANAVSATVEDSCVLVFTAALAVLDVDGDELLDPAVAEVLLGSCVDCAMDPAVLDKFDASLC